MQIPVLAVHIVAGSLAIIFGFVALYAAKGAALHRRVGMLFVYAMLTMATVGGAMAIIWDKAPTLNAPMALFVMYLVLTSLMTVRPPVEGSQRIDIVMLLVALGVTSLYYTFGIQVLTSAAPKLARFTMYPLFIFGSIAAMATIGDVRMIRGGGVHSLRGAKRIARHLWRMCMALLIAAFSFFIGQAKVIPKPIRLVPLLMVPPLLVLFTMLYWMWRVRARRSLRGLELRPQERVRPEPHLELRTAQPTRQD
jgi:uncharacterized membrane protein